MRICHVLMLALTAAVIMACGQEPSRSPAAPEEHEQPKPAEEAIAPTATTDEEKLRSLGPDAVASEVGILCLHLRTTYASGSFPSDLRQRCANSMLALAESYETTSKSADEWISLAKEFGASSSAIKRTKKAAAASRPEKSETQGGSGGTEIENERYANRKDIRQAREFLASLPAACNGSHASASRDGTVTIRLSCEGNDKSMSGSIKIKNGVVTEVQ